MTLEATLEKNIETRKDVSLEEAQVEYAAVPTPVRKAGLRKKLLKRLALGGLVLGGLIGTHKSVLTSCGANTAHLEQVGVPLWTHRVNFNTQRNYYGGFVTLTGFGHRYNVRSFLDFSTGRHDLIEYTHSLLDKDLMVSTPTGQSRGYITKDIFSVSYDKDKGTNTSSYHRKDKK